MPSVIPAPSSQEMAQRDRARRRAAFVARLALLLLTGLSTVAHPVSAQTPVSVLTQHNDNARTGQNLKETLLMPANVNVRQFGLLFAQSVDGAIYGQPLYVPSLLMSDNLVHNVVFVTTGHNTIFAFDADSNQGANQGLLWQRNYNAPSVGISSVPSIDIDPNFTDISPEIGIVGTPVIDPSTNTLFLVVKTKIVTNYMQTLHAIDLSSGVEKGSIILQASVPGTGDGADPVSGLLSFDPLYENQEAGLLLSNGRLYIAFGSYANLGPTFHGWVMAYDVHDPTNMSQVSAFSTSPNGVADTTNPITVPAGAGITMSGAGPAADAAGNLYMTTGLGIFNANLGGTEYGESVLKLNFSQPQTVADFFTPFNFSNLNQSVQELGTGGTVVLPDAAGSAQHPHLLVAAGQEGTIYLLDRDNLGGFNSIDNSQILQSLPDTVGSKFGAPAYFNNSLYFQATGDVLKQFAVSNAMLSSTPVSKAPLTDIFGYSGAFDFPGASPSISANGAQHGIVWTVEQYRPPQTGTPFSPNGVPLAVLHAYDAGDVSRQLYSSFAAGARDTAGFAVNYSVPTIANGKVYVGASNQIAVYGLFPAGTPAPPTQAAYFFVNGLTNVNQNTGNYFHVTAFGPNSKPIKLTGAYVVHEAIGFGGNFLPLQTLHFNNQSDIVVSQILNQGGEFLVTDNYAHQNSPSGVNVFSPASHGVNHLIVRAPAIAQDGQTITVTITAISANGTPTNAPVIVTNMPKQGTIIFTSVHLAYTNPDGTTTNSPYASVLAMGDPNFGFASSRITVAIKVHGVGKHVILATSTTMPNGIIASGTALVTVLPKSGAILR